MNTTTEFQPYIAVNSQGHEFYRTNRPGQALRHAIDRVIDDFTGCTVEASDDLVIWRDDRAVAVIRLTADGRPVCLWSDPAAVQS